MGRGKASQHGVCLNQCWRCDDHFGPPGEPPLDFICSGLMMFVPRAYGRNHAASIRKKNNRHALARSTRAFFAQGFSGPLDCIRRKTRSISRGNRHEQSPLPFELHRQRGRSNGDGAFFPTDLERHSWLYPRLAANIFGNYQPSGVINGCFHGIKNTIYSTICQAPSEARIATTWVDTPARRRIFPLRWRRIDYWISRYIPGR